MSESAFRLYKTMQNARIICIGKIRTGYWEQACAHYLKLLRGRVVMVCLRDSDSSLARAMRIQQEGKRIAACLKPEELAVAMTDTGQAMSSRQFADFIRDCREKYHRPPAFLIGGPFGLAADVMEKAAIRLSLSPMTFPHELAAVLLAEQIYRAESILNNTPYHH